MTTPEVLTAPLNSHHIIPREAFSKSMQNVLKTDVDIAVRVHEDPNHVHRLKISIRFYFRNREVGDWIEAADATRWGITRLLLDMPPVDLKSFFLELPNFGTDRPIARSLLNTVLSVMAANVAQCMGSRVSLKTPLTDKERPYLNVESHTLCIPIGHTEYEFIVQDDIARQVFKPPSN